MLQVATSIHTSKRMLIQNIYWVLQMRVGEYNAKEISLIFLLASCWCREISVAAMEKRCSSSRLSSDFLYSFTLIWLYLMIVINYISFWLVKCVNNLCSYTTNNYNINSNICTTTTTQTSVWVCCEHRVCCNASSLPETTNIANIKTFITCSSLRYKRIDVSVARLRGERDKWENGKSKGFCVSEGLWILI